MTSEKCGRTRRSRHRLSADYQKAWEIGGDSCSEASFLALNRSLAAFRQATNLFLTWAHFAHRIPRATGSSISEERSR